MGGCRPTLVWSLCTLEQWVQVSAGGRDGQFEWSSIVINDRFRRRVTPQSF